MNMDTKGLIIAYLMNGSVVDSHWAVVTYCPRVKHHLFSFLYIQIEVVSDLTSLSNNDFKAHQRKKLLLLLLSLLLLSLPG